MKREHFIQLVEEVLDSLPMEFRERIHNLAVPVEDRPRMRKKPRGLGRKIGRHWPGSRVLGVFQGVPATQKSVFNLLHGTEPHSPLPEKYRGGLLERGRNSS